MAMKGEITVQNHEGTALEGPRENGSSLVFEFDHQVYLPFDQEENRVLIVPIKYGHEFAALYNPSFNYLEKTWISFDFDGQVSVHISRKDYLDYKDDLAFDHLCESMGQLFITFADFYMKGDKVRITDRLGSVKMGLFS